MTNLEWLNRKCIFLLGKGGVGKTTLAKATAEHLASQGKRVLLCHVLHVQNKEQKLEEIKPGLFEINLNAATCFEEYIQLKLKIKALYSLFLGSKVTQYMEKAAPGIRELVLTGKVWYERKNYDHVVIDMPSTGYALTMLHTPFNFANLFPGGPVHRDANDMISTFKNPEESAFVIVSLAEEMPYQESLECEEEILKLTPQNKPSWIFNRVLTFDFSNLYSTAEANQTAVQLKSHFLQKQQAQEEVLKIAKEKKPLILSEQLLDEKRAISIKEFNS
jgi:anion-transporting  ArsA/GET3 family ATPase